MFFGLFGVISFGLSNLLSSGGVPGGKHIVELCGLRLLLVMQFGDNAMVGFFSTVYFKMLCLWRISTGRVFENTGDE